jgi:hypothetical protein
MIRALRAGISTFLSFFHFRASAEQVQTIQNESSTCRFRQKIGASFI